MDSFRAAIRVRPGARSDRVGGRTHDARTGQLPALEVRVRARPVEGAATEAAERVLADALGLRPRQVSVVKGATTRDKMIEVSDPPDDILVRWKALLDRTD